MASVSRARTAVVDLAPSRWLVRVEICGSHKSEEARLIETGVREHHTGRYLSGKTQDRYSKFGQVSSDVTPGENSEVYQSVDMRLDTIVVGPPPYLLD